MFLIFFNAVFSGEKFDSKIDKSKLAQLLSELVQDFNKLSLKQQSNGSSHEDVSTDNEAAEAIRNISNDVISDSSGEKV